tara:strand:- start:17 stop:583 length:567 start_codon:yes stop_codon:yes gene_type:complete
MASRLAVRETNSNQNKKSSVFDSALSKETKYALLKKEKQSQRGLKKRMSTPSVKRGRESTFWKNVKDITPNIHWTRIETYGTPGLPDLLGVFLHEPKNISFWCELKIAKGHQLLLSPFQISWNVKRFSLCQDNFIMAKIPETREVCLWSGSLVRELVTNYKEVEPLFKLSQPYKDSLEPSIRKVLSKI